jgi:hypothetical protein
VGGAASNKRFRLDKKLSWMRGKSERPKPVFSRGDAEARRKSGLSALVVSPWLRGSVRALAVCPKPKPGSLAKARRRQERLWNGVFFAFSRLCERNHALVWRNPDLSRGHGDTRKAEAISIGVSPRLSASARTFGSSDRNSCSLAETLRRGGNRGCRLRRFPRGSVAP